MWVGQKKYISQLFLPFFHSLERRLAIIHGQGVGVPWITLPLKQIFSCTPPLQVEGKYIPQENYHCKYVTLRVPLEKFTIHIDPWAGQSALLKLIPHKVELAQVCLQFSHCVCDDARSNKKVQLRARREHQLLLIFTRKLFKQDKAHVQQESLCLQNFFAVTF